MKSVEKKVKLCYNQTKGIRYRRKIYDRQRPKDPENPKKKKRKRPKPLTIDNYIKPAPKLLSAQVLR